MQFKKFEILNLLLTLITTFATVNQRDSFRCNPFAEPFLTPLLKLAVQTNDKSETFSKLIEYFDISQIPIVQPIF